MTRKEAIMLWFQTNVVWKPEALKDQKAFLAMLEKMAAKALRSYDPMESYGPARYPRAPKAVAPFVHKEITIDTSVRYICSNKIVGSKC